MILSLFVLLLWLLLIQIKIYGFKMFEIVHLEESDSRANS